MNQETSTIDNETVVYSKIACDKFLYTNSKPNPTTGHQPTTDVTPRKQASQLPNKNLTMAKIEQQKARETNK